MLISRFSKYFAVQDENVLLVPEVCGSGLTLYR